ncbi:hypothetical protein O4J56_17505 [Nocardiopsis sp. RSe5-2]|uniref:Uncharacterized protein n=1 Tax=Nocardiopsis endophytica TaxID=3018445 RepID=A0ABT4U667_9ACTN|nr:hypothetical protein [Nocardiopsis endophytica]MDA2812443.1 hypothetical protein [Nocardiopsis endophytica]
MDESSPDEPMASADQSLAEAVTRTRETADADVTVDDILQVIDAARDSRFPPTQG